MASCPSAASRHSRSGEPGLELRALRFLLAFSLAFLLSPELLRAEADTLAKGDVSMGLTQTAEPFNRYWYHYNGPNDCNTDEASSPPEPCSRFNWNSYKVYDFFVLNDQEQRIEDTLVGGTNLRIELGLHDRLTVSAETQLAYVQTAQPAWSLGDSRLGFKWRAIEGNQTIFSVAGGVKLPGTYLPNRIDAPGNRQTDLELRGLVGGLAMRRKLYYDVGFGYRMRLPFKAATMITVEAVDPGAPLNDTCTDCLVTGPADEVFADFAVGLYTSRRVLLFLNGAAVNSFGGYDLADYFKLNAKAGSSDYKVTGDPTDILTSLEEDHIRLGLGVLFKAYYNTTAYINYSYVVLGQNTAAFLVTQSGIPIGSFAVGLEYTFGTKKSPSPGLSGRSGDLRDTALTMRLPRGSADLR